MNLKMKLLISQVIFLYILVYLTNIKPAKSNSSPLVTPESHPAPYSTTKSKMSRSSNETRVRAIDVQLDPHPNGTSIAINFTSSNITTGMIELHALYNTFKASTYKITYAARLIELLTVNHRDVCIAYESPYRHVNNIEFSNSLEDINKCKALINNFGGGTDSNHLESHCDSHEVIVQKPNEVKNFTVTINNLLPSRLYFVSIAPVYKEGKENLWNRFSVPLQPFNAWECTHDGVPLFPPQTDLGSFEIIYPNNSRRDKTTKIPLSRTIKIFWRPVPTLLAGHEPRFVQVTCYEGEKEIFDKDYPIDQRMNFDYSDLGEKELELNSLYTCMLKSVNLIGASEKFSLIHIPEQSRIIETVGKFKLYAARNETHFFTRWTDIHQAYSKWATGNHTLFGGTYTFYICTNSHGRECAGILLMMKFEDHKNASFLHEPIIIPKPATIESNTFGISYRSPDNIYFTGIIWAQCVGNPDQLKQPLEITSVDTISTEELSVEWYIQHCYSNIVRYRGFHIEYCDLGPIDPCDPNEIIEPVFLDGSSSRCNNTTVKNDLTSKARIRGLKPVTQYSIRIIGLVYGADHMEPWSDSMNGKTGIPEELQCRRITLRGVLSSVAALIVFITLLVRVCRFLNHYGFVIHLIRTSKAKFPYDYDSETSKGDNLSSVGLKYWLNGRPICDVENPSNNESPLEAHENNSKRADSFMDIYFSDDSDDNLDGDNESPCSIPDYIDPSHMLTSQTTQSNQDTHDNLTDSSSREKESFSDLDDDDEVSLTSHSSFLANILNDGSSST